MADQIEIFALPEHGFMPMRQGDPVRLRADSCLSIRRPGMDCGLCRAVCPVAVLGGGLWSLTLDKAGCLGCGLCAAACPTGAIMVDGAAPAPSDAAVLTLECRRVPEALRAEGAATVPCLGGVTAPDLLNRLADGTGRIVLMDRGLCEGCGVAACAAPWAAQVEATRATLAAIAPDEAARITVAQAALPQDRALPVIELRPALKPTRREFFRRLTAPAPVCKIACKSDQLTGWNSVQN
ncbi:MAG: ferredoxin family protein [Pseudorhodobacter sp.]|nr:ferredoxin family protein [Pseudorhodobacter sp.]